MRVPTYAEAEAANLPDVRDTAKPGDIVVAWYWTDQCTKPVAGIVGKGEEGLFIEPFEDNDMFNSLEAAHYVVALLP